MLRKRRGGRDESTLQQVAAHALHGFECVNIGLLYTEQTSPR